MEDSEEDFRLLMKLTKEELPAEDFEDRVMNEIEDLQHVLEEINKTRKYALIFFVLAALSGMVMNFLFAETISAFNWDNEVKDNIQLVTHLIYVVLIVVLSEKVWSLFKFFMEEKQSY